MVASQINEPYANVRIEAQAWVQELKELEIENQQLLAGVIYWSTQIAQASQLYRKLMTLFIKMAQNICENGLQQKEQTYTGLQVAERAVALLNFSETYKTLFENWKTHIDLFEQENQLSEKSIELYEQLSENTQQNVYQFLEENEPWIAALLAKNEEQLELILEKLDTKLYDLQDRYYQTVDSIEPEQKTLFGINMMTLAADVMWEKSFLGIQAALRASRPKEIIEQITQNIFDVYFQELCENSDFDWQTFFNENELILK